MKSIKLHFLRKTDRVHGSQMVATEKEVGENADSM